MAADLMLLIFDVNGLIRRLMRGDLTVGEVPAENARLLATIAEEASVRSGGVAPSRDTA